MPVFTALPSSNLSIHPNNGMYSRRKLSLVIMKRIVGPEIDSFHTTTVVAQEMSFCCLVCISCATLDLQLQLSEKSLLSCEDLQWKLLPNESCEGPDTHCMIHIESLIYITNHSLSVIIVSLININNWPYLRINNFQLMDQTRSMA